jgi:hypothetical protein
MARKTDQKSKTVAAKNTAVAVKKETGKGVAVVADNEFAGLPTGFEGTKSTDFIIPRLTILQALSPQVVDGGQKPSLLWNTALDTEVSAPAEVIFVQYSRVWITWHPRKLGGGLVSIEDESPDGERQSNGTIMLDPAKGKDSDYAVETAQFIGLLRTGPKTWDPVFIPMSSTQLKKAKKIMTSARNYRLENSAGVAVPQPLFARSYMLSVTKEQNAEGSWFGWTVEDGRDIRVMEEKQDLIAQIGSLVKAVASGKATFDHEAGASSEAAF